MNPCILKLAKQAGIDVTALSGTYIGGFPREDMLVLNDFAESIIKECISILDKEVYLATREDGEQAHIDVILLEHFGVE